MSQVIHGKSWKKGKIRFRGLMTSLEIEQRRIHVLANPIKEKSNNLRI